MILVFSFLYIWLKINDTRQSIGLQELFTFPFNASFYLVILLVFLNWGIEALKWKMLLRPLEEVSFRRSAEAVLSGVTISIFSPNRIGEFAGRIFFLEKADKIQAAIASMIGSLAQLVMTIAAGLMGYFILETRYDFFGKDNFLSPYFFPLFWGVLLAVALLLAFIYIKRATLFARFRRYIETVTLYSSAELRQLLFLSFLRYIVFSIQYYLVLRLFGINAGMVILFCLIALTFFVISAIPTFALTEIAVRGATATFFFSTISTDTSGIIAASMLLWIINLVFPALIGSLFIWKLKFFKT